MEEYEIDEFLADDDEYNKTDKPTAERPNRNTQTEEFIQMQVPIVIDPEDSPKMYEDTDSVSTFRPQENSKPTSVSPSKKDLPQK